MNLWGYAEKTPGPFLWKVFFCLDNITLNTQWLQPSLAWKILSKAQLCGLSLICCVSYVSFSFLTMKTSFPKLESSNISGLWVFNVLSLCSVNFFIHFFFPLQIAIGSSLNFTIKLFCIVVDSIQNRWCTLSFATIYVRIRKT